MSFNCQQYQNRDIQVLLHHLYEYKKGVRQLALHTMSVENLLLAENLLHKKEVAYQVQRVSETKVNIFLGKPECVQIVQSFGGTKLNELTHEQDFMLGIMLGYDKSIQYERYLKRTKRKLLECSV